MFNLINESDKINVSLSNCSGAEEHFSTSKQCLANQNTDDGDFASFEVAEVSYKVWQESVALLQEHTEIMT
jgi:hypothetical protein